MPLDRRPSGRSSPETSPSSKPGTSRSLLPAFVPRHLLQGTSGSPQGHEILRGPTSTATTVPWRVGRHDHCHVGRRDTPARTPTPQAGGQPRRRGLTQAQSGVVQQPCRFALARRESTNGPNAQPRGKTSPNRSLSSWNLPLHHAYARADVALAGIAVKATKRFKARGEDPDLEWLQ
jgi:hypothetical protein